MCIRDSRRGCLRHAHKSALDFLGRRHPRAHRLALARSHIVGLQICPTLPLPAGADRVLEIMRTLKTRTGGAMSEGAKTSPKGGGFQFKVRGPRDFYGGLALIALG